MRLQGVVHLDLALLSKDLKTTSLVRPKPVLGVNFHLTIFANGRLVFGKSSRDDLLDQSVVSLAATDQESGLKQLTKPMCKKLLKNAGVFGFVPCDCHQACLSIFHHTGNVVVPVLQNLQPRRVQHIAALYLLLQVNLLLLPLIILHDLEPLLLNKPPLLDVELFLGLGVDLFGFLIGFLILSLCCWTSLPFSMLNSSSALASISSAFSLASCSMKAIMCWICFCTSLSESAIFKFYYLSSLVEVNQAIKAW